MKKPASINLFLPLVILVVLVGLGIAVLVQEKPLMGSPEPEETAVASMQTAFTATAEISYKGISFVADCNKTDADTLSLAITEPASLAGVSLAIAGGNATVSYKDLSVTLDQNSFLGKSAAALLLSTLNAAGAEQGVSFELTDSALVINGNNDDGDFSLTVDPTTGAIISVSIPDEDFSGDFSFFQILPEDSTEEDAATQSAPAE